MPFELQPRLAGETLELRPMRPDDFSVLFAVASDRLIWEQHPASDRYREDVFRNFFRDALASGGALVVLERSDDSSAEGRMIGSSRYNAYDEVKGEIEIGWTFLARSHWGGATNRELKRLMLGHAFRFVQAVLFHVGPRNFRSQRAMEKVGAVRAGTRLDPSGREDVVFRIEAADFAASPLFRGE
jgi:RimJ/RimL family protein N-acetyltransferase